MSAGHVVQTTPATHALHALHAPPAVVSPCVRGPELLTRIPPQQGQPATIAVVRTGLGPGQRAYVADTVAGRCLGWATAVGAQPWHLRWEVVARDSLGGTYSVRRAQTPDGALATRASAVQALFTASAPGSAP